MRQAVLLLMSGLSLGMLLFLISTGLSLIFGLARVVNIAHGAFYLAGGYVGVMVGRTTGNFVLAVFAAALVGGLIGSIIDRFFLSRVGTDPLAQVLMTFGFLLVIADSALAIWGGQPRSLSPPGWFVGSVAIGPALFSRYRLFLIVLGVAIFVLLWAIETKTILGASVRAAMDDRVMAAAVGINVRLVAGSVFAVGSALAGMAGALGAAFIGIYPGAEFEILVLAFVVVVVGGVGSIVGTFVAGLGVGLVNAFAVAWVPQVALFIVFAPLVLVLAFKPGGLFGEET